MKWYYMDVSHPNAYRRAEKINAKNVQSAKRTASRYAIYPNIYIGKEVDENGFIVNPLYVKRGGKWYRIEHTNGTSYLVKD